MITLLFTALVKFVKLPLLKPNQHSNFCFVFQRLNKLIIPDLEEKRGDETSSLISYTRPDLTGTH